jgi:hypothetical protein
MKTAWSLGHRIREAMKETRDLFTEPKAGTPDEVIDAST